MSESPYASLPMHGLLRVFALLQAAERLGVNALGWMPYTDEVPEAQRATLTHDTEGVERDLGFVRNGLADAKAEILRRSDEAGRA